MTRSCACFPWIPPLSVQPIHPFEIEPDPVDPGEHRYGLAPSHAAVFAFRLAPEGSAVVGVVHTAPITVQDRSLRVWVSALPMGASGIVHPLTFTHWEANRVPNHHVVVYDGPKPSVLVPTLLVAPGILYLNVLNLVNSSNEFALRLTRCACNATP